MIRLVLAVALAAAILTVVTPALENAKTARTERLADRELGRVASAAETLVREESPGARRTLSISLPGKSPTSAPLAFVSLGGVPDGAERTAQPVADSPARDVLAYRIAGGPTVVRRVGVDLRVRRGSETTDSDARSLVLRGSETFRLTLRLVRIRGRPTVVVGVGTEGVGVVDSLPESARGKPPPPPDLRPSGVRPLRERGAASHC